MQKIMIIEDDSAIREELSLILKNEGYDSIPVTDFTDIPELAGKLQPDLILLDIGLPKEDGFWLCTRLKKSISAPIIFLTCRDSGTDEVRALGLGGDDYITKPYTLPVLLARIHAVLRRSGSMPEQSKILEIAGLSLEPVKGTLSTPSQTILLTRNELQIMACLMEHAGEIVSRADLIETLWNNRIYIDDNTLSVNMTRLRGKLAGLGYSDFIKTRRGMGYQI